MDIQPSNCLFCNIDPGRIIAENELAYVVHDGYPVTELHTLIIPKRHTENYFGLTYQLREASYQLTTRFCFF